MVTMCNHEKKLVRLFRNYQACWNTSSTVHSEVRTEGVGTRNEAPLLQTTLIFAVAHIDKLTTLRTKMELFGHNDKR